MITNQATEVLAVFFKIKQFNYNAYTHVYMFIIISKVYQIKLAEKKRLICKVCEKT